MNAEAKRLNHKRGFLLEELNNLKHEAEMISARMAEQKRELHDKQDEISSKEIEIEQIETLSIFEKDYPKGFVDMRNEGYRMQKQMESDDITVGRQKELEKKVAKLTENLKKICDHRLLVGYSGHHDFHDGDDSYPGCRKCVFCGVQEGGDDYKVLTLDGAKLLYRAEWHSKNNEFFSINVELSNKLVGEIEDYFKQALKKERWRISRLGNT